MPELSSNYHGFFAGRQVKLTTSSQPPDDKSAIWREYYETKKPVKARVDSRRYRMSKFYKRNRKGIGITATAMFIIVALIAFYTIQITQEHNRAQVSAQKATQMARFLTGLFEANDPANSGDDTLTAHDLLIRGRKRISDIDNPAVKAGMLKAIGNAYHDLGFSDTAEVVLNKAIKNSKRAHGYYSVETADALSRRGYITASSLNYDLAIPYYRKAYQIKRTLYGKDDLKLAGLLLKMGIAMRNIGKLDSAVYFMKKANTKTLNRLRKKH